MREKENSIGKLWMFHRIAPDRPETVFHKLDRNTRVTPKQLEQCILQAKEDGYRFVSIDEFLEKKHKGIGDKNDIVITIDDGYRDIYEYARPVFEKHNVPYLFYVASDFIQYGFDRCARPEFDGSQLAMDIIYQNTNFVLNGKSYSARTEDEKYRLFNDLWKIFKRVKRFHPWMSGRRLLARLLKVHPLDFDTYHKKYACSAAELRELAGTLLCTIGSHSKSHTPLHKIWWRPKLKQEFSESKRILEEMIGVPVEHFSYPYGSYCKKVDALVRQYYKSASAVYSIRGEADADCRADEDDYILPRVDMTREKIADWLNK